MNKGLFEELAKSYGIRIHHSAQENGGLYYTDSNDTVKELGTIFGEELIVPVMETISIGQCHTFDRFSTTGTSISVAA